VIGEDGNVLKEKFTYKIIFWKINGDISEGAWYETNSAQDLLTY
jgi:hypothetical protein